MESLKVESIEEVQGTPVEIVAESVDVTPSEEDHVADVASADSVEAVQAEEVIEASQVKVGHAVDPSASKVKNSKNFVKDLLEYIQSSKFITRCREAGSKLGVPPQKVANGFLTRILATVGDVLHTGIFYTQDILSTTITILADLLRGATSILCTVADGLVRLLTLNKTLTH